MSHITITPPYSQEIDFVFLWCDGSDPKFIERKIARMKEANPDLVEENVGDIRYVQHDELKYALRSVALYAPWIRHIFVVTDNQRPSWLNDHPKVSVIDHKEIIPAKLLPVFSSICIEMYLDKIPGLSEHFIYANDDMILNRRLEPCDFFTSNGKPIVWMSKKDERKITPEIADKILNDSSINDWQKTVIRAWDVYRKKSSNPILYHSPAHSIDAFTKTLFRKVIKRYPELLEANSAPFRTGNEISRVLFSYEMVNTFHCQCIFNQKVNFLARLRNKFFPVEMLAIVRDNVKKMKRDIRVFNPKTVCINNLTDEKAVEAIAYLKSRLPTPAPWEK